MANRSSDSFDGGSNYRNDGEARQVLEKANFDLKMKVFYLEENLKNSSKLNEDDEARSENESLKYQLQEKIVELDQRNMLLGKAKKAMEGLKSQVELLKSQDSDRSQRQCDLEERAERLKLSSEQMDIEYKKQIAQYEAELLSLRHNMSSKEMQCENAESANISLEKILLQTNQKLEEMTNANRRLEDESRSMTVHMGDLADEITQETAQIELYKLQLDEQADDQENLQNLVRDLKTRLSESTSDFERQIRSINQSHDEEIKGLKEHNAAALADFRDNYTTVQGRVTEDIQQNLHEKHSHEMAIAAAKIEELSKRLELSELEYGKQSDLLKDECANSNQLAKDCESAGLDQLRKDNVIELLKKELESKTDEVQRLVITLEEVDNNVRHYQELNLQQRSDLQHQAIETQELKGRLEKSTDSMESLLATNRECEDAIKKNEQDASVMNKDCQSLRIQVNEIGTISRENERLKITNMSLSNDVKEAVQAKLAIGRELQLRAESVSRLEDELHQLQLIGKEKDVVAQTLRSRNEMIEKCLEEEKDSRKVSDSALSEQRQMFTSVQAELAQDRKQHDQSNFDLEEQKKLTAALEQELGHACRLSYDAMKGWDILLTEATESSLYRSFGEEEPYEMDALAERSAFKIRSTIPATPIMGAGDSFSSDFEVSDWSRRLDRTPSTKTQSYSFMAQNHNQIVQQITARIERVSSKMNRIRKLREVFERNRVKHEEAMTANMNMVDDKIALFNHRFMEIQKRSDALKTVFDRDSKLRASETLDMRNFREEVIVEHSGKLRESEIRFVQQQQALDQEKHTCTDLRLQNDNLHKEIEKLGDENYTMRQELEQLARMEHIVSELANKTDELKENNRLLSYEVDERGHQLGQVKDISRVLLTEKNSLMEAVDRLQVQVRARDEIIAENELSIGKLEVDIGKLRKTQMDPALADTIRASQSLLSGGKPLPTPVAKGGDAATAQLLDGNFHRVEQLFSSTSDLCRQTKLLYQQFFQSSQGLRDQLSQDVNELLLKNTKLAGQFQQLLSDYRALTSHNSRSNGLGSSLAVDTSNSPDVIQPFSAPKDTANNMESMLKLSNLETEIESNYPRQRNEAKIKLDSNVSTNYPVLSEHFDDFQSDLKNTSAGSPEVSGIRKTDVSQLQLTNSPVANQLLFGGNPNTPLQASIGQGPNPSPIMKLSQLHELPSTSKRATHTHFATPVPARTSNGVDDESGSSAGDGHISHERSHRNNTPTSFFPSRRGLSNDSVGQSSASNLVMAGHTPGHRRRGGAEGGTSFGVVSRSQEDDIDPENVPVHPETSSTQYIPRYSTDESNGHTVSILRKSTMGTTGDAGSRHHMAASYRTDSYVRRGADAPTGRGVRFQASPMGRINRLDGDLSKLASKLDSMDISAPSNR